MLKLLGLIFICCDSIGIAFFPNTLIPRLLGRLAFPIFAYLLAETAKKSEPLYPLINRLLMLAFISQFPYLYFRPDVDFSQISLWEAFFRSYLPGLRSVPGLALNLSPGLNGSPGLNLGFTFVLSLVAIEFLRSARTHHSNRFKVIASFSMILIILWTAFFIRVELGAYGIAMVLLFYNSSAEEKGLSAKLFMILPLLINLFSMMIQSLTLLSVPLIRYTKKIRPDLIADRMLYMIYPIHFLILGLLLRQIRLS